MLRILPGGGTVRSKFVATVLAGSFAVLAIAGCTSDPTPPPANSGGATTSTTTSAAPTSTIVNPLSTTKLSSDLCSGFTDAQLSPYLGALSSKDHQSTDNGPQCVYNPQNPLGASVGVAVISTPSPTQQSLYDSQRLLPWRQKISPIAGYPAVDSSSKANPAQAGECVTIAAVNEQQSLHIDFSAIDQSDANFAKPCTASEALMAELIQNVQAGGS